MSEHRGITGECPQRERSISEMVIKKLDRIYHVVVPAEEASRRLLAVSWQANLTGWQSVVEVNSTRHFSTEEPLLSER